METAIIAALVAGGVSLIGLLVNMRIAKETRRGALTQMRFASALKFAEDAVRELKTFCSQIERFRIFCWRITTDIEAWEINPAGSPGLAALADRRDTFMEQFHTFFDAWASVRSDVPD